MKSSHPDARVPDKYGHRYDRPVILTPYARRSLAAAITIWVALASPFVIASVLR